MNALRRALHYKDRNKINILLIIDNISSGAFLFQNEFKQGGALTYKA